MALATYRYTSDDGMVYSVLLDDALEVALNYAPATGNEPFLPSYYAPRYAQFVDPILGLCLSAVITAPFGGASPPPAVTVNAILYKLKSAVGETRFATGQPLVPVIGGPKGDKGEPGTAGGTLLSIVGTTLNGDYTPSTVGRLFTFSQPANRLYRYVVKLVWHFSSNTGLNQLFWPRPDGVLWRSYAQAWLSQASNGYCSQQCEWLCATTDAITEMYISANLTDDVHIYGGTTPSPEYYTSMETYDLGPAA
jgi:hypothetical protein